MDFFEKQELARRRTKWLVVYFLLAVLGIIAALVDGVLGGIPLAGSAEDDIGDHGHGGESHRDDHMKQNGRVVLKHGGETSGLCFAPQFVKSPP